MARVSWQTGWWNWRLAKLRGAGRVAIACARCLGEGVDIPSLDMVALAEPRRSVVDITQIVGRVSRPSPGTGKTHGYVVIPVMVDPSAAGQWAAQPEAPADALSVVDKEFANVVSILRALAQHDEVLAGQVSRARQKLGEGGDGPDFTPFWELPLFGSFGEARLRAAPVDAESLWAKVLTKLVRMDSDPWDEKLGQLKRYIAEHHGSAAVPRDYQQIPGLGPWVHAQREQHKDGSPLAARSVAHGP